MHSAESIKPRSRAFGIEIYLIEGALLGLFMVSACSFGTLLEYPNSPVHQLIQSSTLRRAIMGLAMGLTGLMLVYSPWGKRSGPHMNPAVTLCFMRLGRIRINDAICFVVAQFHGSIIAVCLMELILRNCLYEAPVNSVATVPGSSIMLAWIVELLMTFFLMSVVLIVNRNPRIAPYTGCFTAFLVTAYIFIAAPISGMSMNPARTFGSAIFAGTWHTLWIYFTAPPLGMLLSVELQRLITRNSKKLCGKLTHHSNCIFPCNCLESR